MTWDKDINITHGESGKGMRTPEYRAWAAAKNRCSNPNDKAYRRYGGRGIRFCERWAGSFENFLLDMGRKPSKTHSLDRINNDGHYNPYNCRWATRREQCLNRTYKLTKADVDHIRAEVRTSSQANLARYYGVDPSTISRIISGKEHPYAA